MTKPGGWIIEQWDPGNPINEDAQWVTIERFEAKAKARRLQKKIDDELHGQMGPVVRMRRARKDDPDEHGNAAPEEKAGADSASLERRA